MAETPINLNKARKAKARLEAERQATENRVKFGRTKAQKAAGASAIVKMVRDLDGHKRGR